MTDVRGTYLLTEPKTDFPDFKNKNWVFLDRPYYKMTLDSGVTGILPKVEKSMFGPPERCYDHVETNEKMVSLGPGGNIYIPWKIGTLYYKYGYDEFKRLMVDIMEKVKPVPKAFETNAPEMIEIFFAKCDDSTYMLQLINLTGFNGITFFKPLRVDNIDIKFNEIVPKNIWELAESGMIPVACNNKLTVSMPDTEIYKAFLVRV